MPNRTFAEELLGHCYVTMSFLFWAIRVPPHLQENSSDKITNE